AMPEHLEIRNLGLTSFEEALAVQEAAVKAVLAGGPEVLLLLEHTPVFTIGRTRDQSSLGSPAKLPAPVFETNRGGQATFHGPGQLVGYPILNLARRGRDLHAYLRFLETFLGALCREFGVETAARPGLTGAWAGERKIASIGVGVRHWVSMHGFALNVCNDLTPFLAINPAESKACK
ncbi:MAG: lipoyl(octanoyl) transferase LipB, partial [Terrimicrobiaceae bacterium]|nr:lipoyl(octanoyl) transferase LipB [Terrimicrobiaceae bacterium]